MGLKIIRNLKNLITKEYVFLNFIMTYYIFHFHLPVNQAFIWSSFTIANGSFAYSNCCLCSFPQIFCSCKLKDTKKLRYFNQ